tara:strand:- start:183 stop:494 length:312 start_codon:yes stop_codon:yes gene_type:complete
MASPCVLKLKRNPFKKMNEYLCNVFLAEQKDTIKTYASSVLEAFDNLISMNGVTKIISVTDKDRDKPFYFEGNLTELRKIRKLITDESLIAERLNKVDVKSKN